MTDAEQDALLFKAASASIAARNAVTDKWDPAVSPEERRNRAEIAGKAAFAAVVDEAMAKEDGNGAG